MILTPTELLEQITQESALHTFDPHWLAQKRVELSGLYSYFSGQLEGILFLRPEQWLKIREDCKSDKAADRLWEATENGKKEVIYHLRLRRIEKMMSSFKTMVDVLSAEALGSQ